MVVSWIPLTYSEARGFISHYTVAYTPQTSGRKRQAFDTMTQTVPGMDANTTRIEGLDANTDYIVQVSATNGAGTSELSSITILPAPAGGQEGKLEFGYCLVYEVLPPLEVGGSNSGQGGVIAGAVAVIIALLGVTCFLVIVIILVLKMRRNNVK